MKFEGLSEVGASNTLSRDGEVKEYPYRSDRYYRENGLWFYTTREAMSNGPFSSRVQAERDFEVAMRFNFESRESTSLPFTVAWS